MALGMFLDRLHSKSEIAPSGRRVDFTDRRFFPAPLGGVGEVKGSVHKHNLCTDN